MLRRDRIDHADLNAILRQAAVIQNGLPGAAVDTQAIELQYKIPNSIHHRPELPRSNTVSNLKGFDCTYTRYGRA